MTKYRGTLSVDNKPPFVIVAQEKDSILITLNICARVGGAIADFVNSGRDKSLMMIHLEKLSDQ